MVAKNVVYSGLPSASMTRECSRGVYSIKNVQLKVVTQGKHPLCTWAYMFVTGRSWRVVNIKRRDFRTYPRVEVSTYYGRELGL